MPPDRQQQGRFVYARDLKQGSFLRAKSPLRKHHLNCLQVLILSFLLIASCCVLDACRSTDFFTEVIISRNATTIDDDNPNRTVINSPDASKKSDELAALDWDSSAEQSEEVENLVVYSSKPNSDLKTRHTLFNPAADLEDVESSDGVRLVYSKNASLNHKVKTTEKNKTKAQSQQKNKKNSKKSKSSNAGKSQKKSNSQKSQSSKNKDNASKNGKDTTNSGGKTSSEASGTNSDDEDGEGGYENVYDPTNKRSTLQQAGAAAGCGQAAVLIEAIGGGGALCAMDEQTYSGGSSQTWQASFKKVFGDELAEGFEDEALLWKDDGSSSDDIDSINDIVEACGQDGVIFFDQNEASYTERFNKAQRKKLGTANIQLVPVDFTTVKGMKDAAKSVAEVLASSTQVSQDVDENYENYCDILDDIVSAVAATHSSSLAAISEGSSTKLTTYGNCPVSSYTYFGIQACVAVDFAKDVSYTPASNAKVKNIDTTDGILFSYCGTDASPVSFWLQVAGVIDRVAKSTVNINDGETAQNYRIIWQVKNKFNASQFSSEEGPFANLSPYWAKNSNINGNNDWCMLNAYGTLTNLTEGQFFGSKYFPYLIVCATQDYTADKIKTKTVKSITKTGTTYSKNFAKNGTGYIGNYYTTKVSNAFNDDNVSPEDSVRANPSGLLGSWTSDNGSMESVLESIWLAKIYSQQPDNSTYEPINTWSKFSVKIGTEQCTDLEEAVKAFYSAVYRYTLTDKNYSAIVSDESLS